MMPMKTRALLVYSLLVLLGFSVSAQGLQASKGIKNYGMVTYSVSDSTLMVINFEDPQHFEYGKDAPIWNAITIQDAVPPFFSPSQDVFHSPNQSVKLVLNDPSTDTQRRLHFEHKWNYDNRHFHVIAWYYLPEDFVKDVWGPEIIRTATTYMHKKGAPWSFPDFEWWKMSLGLDKEEPDGSFRISGAIGFGYVDNDGDGINDYYVNNYRVWAKDTIRKGEWNKLETYVYRDKENGIFQFWLNDKLQWDERNIDTLGISPERIKYAYEHPEEYGMPKVTCGLSLYTGISNIPKIVYFDDVMLSNEPKS